MKKLLLALAFSAPSLCFAAAAPISFDFSGVSLIGFGQATFKNILHRDFVIAPEVLALDRKISVSIKGIASDKVAAFVEDILLKQGIATTLGEDGIYYLSDSKLEQKTATALPVLPVLPLPGSTAPGLTLPVPVVKPLDVVPDEVSIFVPQNRTSDFLMLVGGAAYPHAVHAAAGNLVISGPAKIVKKVRSFLESVDVSPALVDISVSWVEVTRSEGATRGISLLANVLGAKFGVSIGQPSASSITLKGGQFQLMIDMLNTDARFNQVSNSRIVGDDREKMTLTVGDETPTLSATGKDQQGNEVTSVSYRPSGVIVDVLPKVLGSGRINLALDGQISSFKQTSTGVSGSPTLIKRQVRTTVTVGDGDVLLIGGLTDSQETGSKSGLSFLPSSWALKSGSSVKTDLVLILSATVPKT